MDARTRREQRRRLAIILGQPTLGRGWFVSPIVDTSEAGALAQAAAKAEALVLRLIYVREVRTMPGGRKLYAAKLAVKGYQIRRCGVIREDPS
jgi:hypothetical protein